MKEKLTFRKSIKGGKEREKKLKIWDNEIKNKKSLIRKYVPFVIFFFFYVLLFIPRFPPFFISSCIYMFLSFFLSFSYV